MNNSISLLINKKNSNLYFRYRLNGKTKDETITNLPYFAEPKNRDEERINKRSYKQAEQLLWEKRNELAKSEFALDYFEKRNQSFLDFFYKIAEQQGNKSKTTKDGYICSIRKLEAYLENLNMNDISFKQVDFAFCNGFKTFLEGLDNIANTTKSKYFKTFKFVTAQAYNQGYNKKYVCQQIKGIKGEHKHHEYLTIEELKSMIKTETPYIKKDICPTREFFLFSCFTGLPHKECMALRWDDFKREIIDGEEEVYFDYTRFKTDKRNKIPLSGDAKEYLLELYNERTSDPSVFPKLRYTAHENSKIQKWAGMAGVRKKITPHCARATFANMFVRVPKYNIIDLMELMGHSEVKTTLSYIGTSLMEKTQAIRKMPKVLD
jgi:integrase